MRLRTALGAVHPTAKLLALIVIVCLIAWPATSWWRSMHTSHATVQFTNTTGLYVGDPVKVRGVTIGTVDAVTPRQGEKGGHGQGYVDVDVSYDDHVFVASDAQAAIVAPTLVSGRYVQFVNPRTEPSDGALADHATIALGRTAVPVSYDEIKDQVTDLSRQLGPTDGSHGTLSSLVNASADKFGGSGAALHRAMQATSDAMTTLAAGGPDLFGTVRNLQTLVTALRGSDRQIVAFAKQLSGASELLDDNRTELDAAIRAVDDMAPTLKQFLDDNKQALSDDVVGLNRITGLLVDRQDDLAQILHTTPTALSDLYNIYDPRSNSLTGALAIPDYPDPLSLICALLTTVDAPQAECQRASGTFGRVFGREVAAQGKKGGR
ncbi:MCE family protein [Gordonia sp. (in: high G+C Gram-positive bacteria)]|uniref:MCE family protein n=1 Tax=Gordonia sp. (in: high G+C Gram-positive bacteria) TaxID=84139 RepID=UPI003F986A1D